MGIFSNNLTANHNRNLPNFKAEVWAKGLDIDLSSKAWGGDGWVPGNKPGREKKSKNTRIRVALPKNKVEKRIKPSIPALAEFEIDDKMGRTREQHESAIQELILKNAHEAGTKEDHYIPNTRNGSRKKANENLEFLTNLLAAQAKADMMGDDDDDEY